MGLLNNIRPNFLIVGAAKSGTTSLSYYLGQHPEIFITIIKEPRYFASNTLLNINKEDPLYDQIMRTSIFDKTKYYELFNTKKSYKRYGEASVHYLYNYNECIPRIKKELGDIPIIIILRDPAIRAISNYYYLKKYIKKDFIKCIQNENEFIESNFNSFWYFKSQGYYYEQVKNYINNFTKVKTIIFDNFKNDLFEVLKDIFTFLDVDNSFIPNTSSNLNQNKIFKKDYYNELFKLAKKVDFLKKIIIPREKERLKKIKNKYFLTKPDYSLHLNDIRDLRKIYKDDINRLEKILNIELTAWK
jgi:hypothetical protein